MDAVIGIGQLLIGLVVVLWLMWLVARPSQLAYENDLAESRKAWPLIKAEDMPGIYAKRLPRYDYKRLRQIQPFVQVDTDKGFLPYDEIARRLDLIYAYQTEHNIKAKYVPADEIYRPDDDIDLSTIPF